MTDYQILLINNGLLFSPRMTRDEARRHIQTHPKFKYKAAAL